MPNKKVVVTSAHLTSAGELYQQGWALEEISNILGYDVRVVRRALVEAGVTIRPRRNQSK